MDLGEIRDKVAAGEKRQTIRAPRKSRHARPGDPLTFYTGPRMQPRAIGRSVCVSTAEVNLNCAKDSATVWEEDGRVSFAVQAHDSDSRAALDDFARADGFATWAEMREWFKQTHETDVFTGVLIRWGLHPSIPAPTGLIE